ncbi:MAG: hypothetical protein JO250_10005 [Armatimonadetes bacterium]|nr:hypothetical protein [Armatimonadota bacterium]
MIRLPHVSLPPSAQEGLAGFQRQIDAIPDYAARVEEGKRLFQLKNFPTNPTFRQVRRALSAMCSGAQRCCYCEDSAGTDVEHIKPKDLYPELVFVWENYLYACSGCNSPKQSRCVIFSQVTGQAMEVTRRRNDPVVPPEAGDPLLINPRTENPLDFMILDLRGSFYFVPLAAPGSREYLRAEHTIQLLRLNDREFLREARREAFTGYVARLKVYIHEKRNGLPLENLQNLINSIQRLSHATVWQEMKRQQSRLPRLRDLFEAAPEALGW